MSDAFAFLRGGASALWLERDSRAQIDRIRKVRLRRLRDAVAATRRGPERLSEVDPDRPLETQLDRIPPLQKATLMADFEGFVAGGSPSRAAVEEHIRHASPGTLLGGRLVVATTSGTTGEVGWFVFDRTDWMQLRGALMARILRHRLVPHEVARFSFGRRYRMAMVAATGGPYVTYLVAASRTWGTAAIADVRVFSLGAPLTSLLQQLSDFDPHYLHGYPSILEGLAEATLHGRARLRPEFVSMGSEPASRRARRTLLEAFPKAELSETYGATEHVAIANACRYGALHVNEDLCVLEPMDAAGRPVPPGVTSDHVLVSNLLARTQPLLRYRLDDAVTWLDGHDVTERCRCGSRMARIRVEGRSDDVIRLRDGRGQHHAFSPILFETLFLEIEGVRRYQLVHEAQNHLRVLIVADEGADAVSALTRRFQAFIEQSPVRGQVSLQVDQVSEIPTVGGGGKTRQVLYKVG